MSPDIGTKYFAVAFEDVLVQDVDGFSDWSEEVQQKFDIVTAELEQLAIRFGGKVVAITHDGKIEEE